MAVVQQEPPTVKVAVSVLDGFAANVAEDSPTLAHHLVAALSFEESRAEKDKFYTFLLWFDY